MRLLSRLREALGFRIQRSPADVRRILEAELADAISDADWDEFQCVRIADPWLDAIRLAVPLEGAVTPGGRHAVEQGLRRVEELLTAIERAQAAGRALRPKLEVALEVITDLEATHGAIGSLRQAMRYVEEVLNGVQSDLLAPPDAGAALEAAERLGSAVSLHPFAGAQTVTPAFDRVRAGLLPELEEYRAALCRLGALSAAT